MGVFSHCPTVEALVASPRVLILGAGINGAALARELALNGAEVWIVDRADICSGATAYSSRLIHGGLRYLEYGELALVRESLGERRRLRRLAPQFVRPLELFIPLASRWGGLGTSALRFLRLDSWRRQSRPSPRGLWLVRLGLWLYDRYAQDRTLPTHRVHDARRLAVDGLDRAKYRWLCSYHDCQIPYPERFVLALLEDARRLARAAGVGFELLNYHEARLAGTTVEIRAVGESEPCAPVCLLEPAAIVNATGAWVDQTLKRLQVDSPRLIGGTKGSHFLTANRRLAAALAGRGIYAEAADGRPVFILPLAQNTLIGTTDEPYENSPEHAVASRRELEYLVEVVNDILPGVGLSAGDIDMHYSGVRPLPYCGDAEPAGITRRHWLQRHAGTAVPLFSVIGGKLTTCRSLAEEAAATILASCGERVSCNSRDRVLPGGERYPEDPTQESAELDRLARRFGMDRPAVESVWALCGTRTEAVLAELDELAAESLDGTNIPRSFARWVIENEWPRTLSDLVERRLMLLYEPALSERCLRQLAELLAERGVLPPRGVDDEVRRTIERLRDHYGKRVVPARRQSSHMEESGRDAI